MYVPLRAVVTGIRQILKNIRDAIASKTELNGEQKKALYIAEIKKWWAANERRFPDWKPGDKLPEITESRVGETAEE